MAEQKQTYRVWGIDIDTVISNLNQIFNLISNRLDQLEGLRGTPTFYSSSFDYPDGGLTGSLNSNSAGTSADFSDIVALTFSNDGLHILDTDGTHDLIISPGSDLTADRTLSLVTGDASRTITINGDPTLDDWFDQSVKTTASVTFAGLLLGATTNVTATLDEDDLASDSATALATQQSIKAYADAIQSDLDGFPDELKNLTTAEIQQLENINTTTISTTQWGYLGVLDQNLRTTDSVKFGQVQVDKTGAGGHVLLNAANGSIEITREAAGGFIDFRSTTSEDYDARISENSGGLQLTGTGGLLAVFYNAGSTQFYYNHIRSAATSAAGLNIYDTSGSSPGLSMHTDAAGSSAQVSLLQHVSANYLLIRNVEASSGVIRFEGRNTADTDNNVMISANPNGSVSLYYADVLAAQTTSNGILVNDADGQYGLLYFNDVNLDLKNTNHGARIRLIAEDLSGSSKNILVGDPDNYTWFYYAGNQVAATWDDGSSRGFRIYDADSQYADIVKHTDGSALFYNRETSGWVKISGIDSTPAYKQIAGFDPDWGMEVRGNAIINNSGETSDFNRGCLFVWNDPSSNVAGQSAGIQVWIGDTPTATPAADDHVAQTIAINNLNSRQHIWGMNILALQDASGTDGWVRGIELEVADCSNNSTDPFGTDGFVQLGLDIVGHSGSTNRPTAAIRVWANDQSGDKWWYEGISLSRCYQYGIHFYTDPGGSADSIDFAGATGGAAIYDDSDSESVIKTDTIHANGVIDLGGISAGDGAVYNYMRLPGAANTEIVFKNYADYNAMFTLDSGTAATKDAGFFFKDQSTYKWSLKKDNNNYFVLYNHSTTNTVWLVTGSDESRFGTTGTNYSAFESDGTLTFNGNATVWNDANVGGMTLGGPAATLPDEVKFVDEAGGDTGIYSWGFAVGEKVAGAIEFPHSYKEGSDISFHVHWQGNDAPTGTDKVKWQLIYTVAQDGATLDAATTITIETDYDTQYEWVTSAFADITGTNFNMGNQFLFELSRVAATANEYAGDAVIATVGFHYQQDTVGSRQITTK